jgi:hypothetical protein
MSEPNDKSRAGPSGGDKSRAGPSAGDRSGAERDSQDDEAIRALLRKSAPPQSPPLLRGVQRKLRARSKGKFYADGWSTTDARVSYALVALAMLLIIAIAYFSLGPMGITPH